MTYAGVAAGATAAMAAIYNTTLGATAASIDVTSIPATYRTLMGVFSGFHAAGGTTFVPMTLRLNNDSGAAQYYWMGNKLPAVASTYPTVLASSPSGESSMTIGNVSPYKFNYPGLVRFFITGYSNATQFKQVSSMSSYCDGSGSANLVRHEYAGIYVAQAVVNRLTLSVSGSFAAACDFALYGLP